jgi:ribonuclease Y
MNEYMFGLIGIAIGFGLTFLLKSILDRQKQTAANLKSEQIVTEARHQADTLIKEASLEAKDRLIKMKGEFDAETKETRAELKRQERRIIKKEENIDRKLEQQEQREKEIATQEKELQQRTDHIAKQERDYESLVSEQKQQLERISTLTAEQAKELLAARHGERSALRWRQADQTHRERGQGRGRQKSQENSSPPPFSGMPPIMSQSEPSLWFNCPAMR